MNQLTNRIFCVVSRLGDFWVTKDQGKKIMELKQSDPSGFVTLDGNLIAFSMIMGVLDAKSYDDYNKKQNGCWRCKYSYWHERFQKCAHGELKR